MGFASSRNLLQVDHLDCVNGSTSWVDTRCDLCVIRRMATVWHLSHVFYIIARLVLPVLDSFMPLCWSHFSGLRDFVYM